MLFKSQYGVITAAEISSIMIFKGKFRYVLLG